LNTKAVGGRRVVDEDGAARLSLAGIGRDVVRALLSGDLRRPMCREIVPRFRYLQQHLLGSRTGMAPSVHSPEGMAAAKMEREAVAGA
jgi:CBS domain-containing protein